MDAIELLVSDHDTVRGLFEEFRAAAEQDDADEIHRIQREIFDELEVHTTIEEEVFYPAVRELDEEELGEMVGESIQEHHVVKLLMREISDLSDLEVFRSKMVVLMENVEHHAEEEESEMFPQLRSRMSPDELESLGEKLDAAKT